MTFASVTDIKSEHSPFVGEKGQKIEEARKQKEGGRIVKVRIQISHSSQGNNSRV